jgi:cytochrome c-type biogenesis protein CcmF
MIKFEGEHLLPGQIGHFFVILALIASLLSLISFFSASRTSDLIEKYKWEKIAKFSFITQAISIAVIFSVIFFICFNHYFEYMYAYKHASKELEYKYLLACMWEGQEGSFLLWSIWHSVIGLFIIFNKNEQIKTIWRAPVMSVISLAQFFLMLMILGIYFFDIRIGNSPFTLTRNEIPAPIFSRPDYLNFVKDGMGLNVLLRNYWMVIHPPILFLGFASTIVPFAFAYAGLQTKRHTEWIKPLLPWALFSACVLGVGIMMGAKWAYESLSFGGYWAWDPVENASLVPWLILIAGIHTMLIYKSTERSLSASYLFAILTFVFVLYSTFLTRTGILGDTSVHAFTEAGKAINIMIGIFVLSFTLPALGLFFSRLKSIPAVHHEEEMHSREFFMFIGALVFFLSSMFIIIITSIPVYSKTPFLKDLIIKIHGGPLAMPEDAEFIYNKVMIIVAVIIGFLTGVAQYLKYKATTKEYLFKKIIIPIIASSVISTLIFIVYPFTFQKHGIGFLVAIYIGFFFMVYSAISNALYISIILKNNFKFAGGSLAHTGFALMIVGMLISSSNKVVISDSKVNGITVPVSEDAKNKKTEDPTENLTLIRDLPTRMGEYEVTYRSDSSGNETGRKFYSLHFDKKGKDKKTIEQFVVKPDVYIMKGNNMSSNPDTKSYLTKDVFTYISFAMNEKENKDTASFKEFIIGEGEKGFYRNGYFILNSVVKNPNNEKYHSNEGDVSLMADVTFVSKDSMHYRAMPMIKADNLGIMQIDDTVYAQNLYVRFAGVSENHKIKLAIKESESLIDFVTVKSYVFPYINLVWLGLIIMAFGIILSMVKRAEFKPTLTAAILILSTIGLVYMFLFANA